MSVRWRVSERVIHTQLPRGGVVLDPVSKAYFTLNQTGEVLWRALASPAGLDALTAALTTEFEIDDESARADVQRWIEEMLAAGLIIEAADEA